MLAGGLEAWNIMNPEIRVLFIGWAETAATTRLGGGPVP